MRPLSHLIFAIIVLECCFWVDTISAERASVVPSQLPASLSDRWATHIATEPLDASEPIESSPVPDVKKLDPYQLKLNSCSQATEKPPAVPGKAVHSSTDRYSRDKAQKSHESPPQKGKRPKAGQPLKKTI